MLRIPEKSVGVNLILLLYCAPRFLYVRLKRREGQGFILVYSIASRATFERLEVFRQLMLRVKRNRPIFVLVGNKCDKTYEREVSREEGAALACGEEFADAKVGDAVGEVVDHCGG